MEDTRFWSNKKGPVQVWGDLERAMRCWMWPLSSADALRQLSLGPETILSRWSAKVGMTQDISLKLVANRHRYARNVVPNPLSSAE